MAPPKRKGGRTLPATSTSAGAGSSTPATPGRVTKKTVAGSADGIDRPHHATDSSSRYTPPIARELKMSPPWLPWLMGTFLVVGALLIVMNYLGTFWDTSNWVLLGGLGFILGGIITATQWR